MKGKLLAFGVTLLAVATIGVVQLQSKAVDSSRDCDNFAVMRCGALNGDEMRAEYDTNNGSNSNGTAAKQADIQKVFTSMGISRAQLNGSFVPGIVYKNGNVEVDGKIVATGATMAARGLGGTQISGTNAQKVSVSAMGDAQTAMVKMVDGKFKFAIMKPCGNPVAATPKEEPKPEPMPKAECVDLKLIEQERTQFLATATASVSGGAKVKSYTFTVTQGSTTLYDNTHPSTNESQSVVYNLDKPGDYTVKATVDTSEGVKGGPQCKATLTVKPVDTPPPPPPTPAPSVDIVKYVNNDQKYARVNTNVEFNYRIDVKNTGNVDLDNVTVTDTPDKGITLIEKVTPPNTGAKFENNTFILTGLKLLKGETRTFVLYAKVPVALAGKLINTVCVDAPAVPGNPDKCDKAEVEVPPTPVPGKIEVCVLADKTVKMIEQSEYDANPSLYSKNVADCEEQETPEELPQTGPVETVLSVVGVMSLVGSAAYYIASRRQSV